MALTNAQLIDPTTGQVIYGNPAELGVRMAQMQLPNVHPSVATFPNQISDASPTYVTPQSNPYPVLNSNVPFARAINPMGGNITNPRLTKFGKALGFLSDIAQGAMAGREASEQAVMESDGHRGGGFGTGWAAAQQFPFARFMMQNQMQTAGLQNQLLQNRVAMDPTMDQLGMRKSLADIRKAQLVSQGERGIYDTTTGQYLPGTQSQAKADDLQHLYAAAVQDAVQNGRDVTTDQKVHAYAQALAGMKPAPAGSDQARFMADYMAANNMPDTPANRQKAFDAYTQKTKIAPQQVRVEGYGNIREYPVIDTHNNNTLQYLSANDLNAANKQTPGRYVPAGEGNRALSKTALIEDIRGNIQSVRQVLQNPQMPELTASQRAQLAIALGSNDPSGAVSAMIRGGVAGNLTTEQQDYVIGLAQLIENGMAMRSVLGAGQGSEDMRAAIRATIPNASTPTKQYGLKQLDAFEAVLNRLGRGVPSVPLRGQGNKPNKGNDPLGIF